ncbi:MAG TPA: hypothetical protein VFY28_02745 [Candidatus Paceibacterota bacterium]|nr:hypothetical protein [Candidatus Paceibacterota bacterium]
MTPVTKRLVLLALMLLFPVLAHAAWWNPLSWFSNWSFLDLLNNNPKVQTLENRVVESEEGLEIRSASPTNKQSQETDVEDSKEKTPRQLETTVEPIQVPPTKAPSVLTEELPPFVLRCKLIDETVTEGEYIEVDLTIFENNGASGLNRNYEISWNHTDLSEEGDKEGRFRFNRPGVQDITATAKRIVDGVSESVTCSVNVEVKDEEPLVADASDFDGYGAYVSSVPSLPISYSGNAKWVLVLDGSFMTDYALVQRTDGLYSGDLYLVELGIGCIGLSWGTDKWALWTGSTLFLDGIGDTFIDIDSSFSNECHVWDAFPIEDWEYELYEWDYAEFWRAVNSL